MNDEPRMTYRTVFASISKPNVSITPIMYNAAFRALRMDAVYVSFEVSDVARAISAMRAMGFRGFSVSRPYKRSVIPLLDRVDPTAASLGAVNVIRNDEGLLVGHNSDWVGATRAIARYREVSGCRAVVLGAGGAGRAVAYGLRAGGADVYVHNRSHRAALDLAADIGVSVGDWEDWAAVRAADIVANATSVGGPPGDRPELVPDSALREGQVVLDAVFLPHETDLLARARRAGCVVVHGIEMLVEQGAVAFRILTGAEPPVEVMQRAIRTHLGLLEGAAPDLAPSGARCADHP